MNQNLPGTPGYVNPWRMTPGRRLLKFAQFLAMIALAGAVMVLAGFIAYWLADNGSPGVGAIFGLVGLFASVALVEVAGELW